MTTTILQKHLLNTRFVGNLFNGCFAVALCAALLALAQAQSFTGSITGIVTDQNGAVIPGATVTLTATGTGQSRSTTTNSQGEYSFTSLQPGAYKVRVAASSFTTREISTQ